MKNWKFWLGVAVSAIFLSIAFLKIENWRELWLALRVADWTAAVHLIKFKFNWHSFAESIRSADKKFVLLMLAGYVLVFALRTVRWHFILQSVAKVSMRSTFIALIICYMGNNIFPLRAGEVLRVYVLNRRHQVPISSGLATVVVERLADVISMLIFFGLLLLTLKFPPEYQALESAIHKGGILAVVSTLVLLVFLYGLYVGSSLVERIVDRVIRILPERWQEGVKDLLKSFIAGLHILGKPARLLYLILISFAVWVVNLLPVYFVGLSFHWHISPVGCLLLLCLGAVAASIPAAPGFWGTFHYLTSQGLAFLGFGPQETAMSYAIVLHAGYYFPVILLGAILAWREGYSLTSVKQAEQEIKSKD